MRHLSLLPPLLIALAMPPAAWGESVQSIMEKVQERQIARWDGVNVYAVEQSVMGTSLTLAYQRTSIEGPDGSFYPAFQPVRLGSRDDAANLASAAYMAEQVLGEKEGQMREEGVPLDELRKGGPQTPWMNFDPRSMMGNLRQMAVGARDADYAPTDQQKGLIRFAKEARVTGTETLDGRSAHHLTAENLNMVQQSEGQQMRIDRIDMWVDTTEYVPLKMRMTGDMTADGQTRPLVMEKIDTDWRKVPGSSMYEPYHQVMRMSGMLTPEQQEEMQEARQQLNDLEAQMAAMPASQRDTMMRMMEPQLNMLRNMAAGGDLEISIQVNRIVVNPDEDTLAGMLRSPAASNAMINMPQTTRSANVPAAAARPPRDEDLAAARQACLEEKMAKAEAAGKRKRGFGRLLGSAGRLAGRFGGADVSQTMGDVYTANATAEDVAAAARDLGLAESDIDDCENPS